MYAARRLYVKNWDSTPAEERYSVQIEYGGKPVPGIQSDRISGVEEEVMYWRKANHIHGWFVDNVQGGKDDCGKYRVRKEQLVQLFGACEEVIRASKLVDGMVTVGTMHSREHPKGIVQREPGKVIEDSTVAEKLLPVRQGFFFGSYEYDDGYLDDVIQTREWAARMLADIKNGVPGDIIYSSSW